MWKIQQTYIDKKILSDHGITSSFIKTSEKNDLNLPEAAAGAGVLSTICDVVSPSCTSVFIVNKNRNKSIRHKKKACPAFIHVHFEWNFTIVGFNSLTSWLHFDTFIDNVLRLLWPEKTHRKQFIVIACSNLDANPQRRKT